MAENGDGMSRDAGFDSVAVPPVGANGGGANAGDGAGWGNGCEAGPNGSGVSWADIADGANGDGRPVLAESGPVTVPLGRAIAIAADGTITAKDPAAPDAPPETLGRIKLASPVGSRIVKDVNGFLRVPDGGVLSNHFRPPRGNRLVLSARRPTSIAEALVEQKAAHGAAFPLQ